MSDMSIRERAQKYIFKTEMVLRNIKVMESSILISGEDAMRVIEEVKRYFEDAKYYFDRKEYDVSLASIAYCEGLLDALRMLRLARFEW